MLSEAAKRDSGAMMQFRNDAEVNHWTINTHKDPDRFRTRWGAVSAGESVFSCVDEHHGEIVGIG